MEHCLLQHDWTIDIGDIDRRLLYWRLEAKRGKNKNSKWRLKRAKSSNDNSKQHKNRQILTLIMENLQIISTRF